MRFTAPRWRPAGRDHGPPALYPARHPRYFAACVYDPDGYTVEAVTHAPESDGAA